MRLPSLPLLALTSLAALALLPACSLIPEASPDPTRYHTLSLPSAIETSAPAPQGALRIGLRKVELSPYLAKGLLVVRTHDNEIRYDDYVRWAEPLDAAITRTLQSCLQADPRISRVSLPPLSGEEDRAFDLIVRVRRADGLLPPAGQGTRFVAVIELHSTGAGSDLLAQRTFTAPELPWDGRDFNALAQALSSSVQALAREIAAMLPQTTGTPPTPQAAPAPETAP